MKTILVVDDEYALVENLAEMLTDEGYRVVSAANGKEGLLRAQEEKPALVITDFMMPIITGADVVRGMRALPLLRDTPVIMMSATLKSVALADGTVEVDAFLKKPFEWQKLLEAVVRLIGSGKPEGNPSG
jgi:CheY-like chemotaxis protein